MPSFVHSTLRVVALACATWFVAPPQVAAAGETVLTDVLGVPGAKIPAHEQTGGVTVGKLPPTTVHPNAAAALARPTTGKPIDVTQYHYDNGVTGWNRNETALTPATVASPKFGLLSTLAVDGAVQAQPLLVAGYALPDGSTHDVLIVVTNHDTVYAFDAQSYAVLWQSSLGTSQSSTDVGCGDLQPEYGISSTPVIVRSGKKATVYVVAAVEPTANNFHAYLHALDLGTGADVTPAVEIAPSATLVDGTTISFDPKDQYIRSALTSNGTSVYVSVASHCDNGSNHISGWVLQYGADLTSQAAFHTIEQKAGYELSSIWMSGYPPAIDASGNLFFVTGNGNFANGGLDWGESVLRLPSNLASANDYFTPNSYGTLNAGDLDFGSGGIMLLPTLRGQKAPPMAVAMGKEGMMYLLDQTNLGKISARDAGALQATRVASAGAGEWGGPAYYTGPSGGVVFYQTSQDVLKSYSVKTTAHPSLTLAQQGTSVAGFGGASPIVSSNGTTANTAVVWVLRRTLPLQLEAYDAAALGAPIYAANAGTWSTTRAPFSTVMEANGRVYAPAYKTVMVFGLTP